MDEEIAYLESTMKQGVEPGGIIRDSEGNVIGRYGRRSRNDRWYQEWYKAKKRPPSRKELRELAEERLRQGGYAGDEPIGPNEEYIEAVKSLELARYMQKRLKGDKPTVEGLAAQAVDEMQRSYGSTPQDILKQTVELINQEHALSEAAEEKFGKEGFIARQVNDVVEAIRAKNDPKLTDAEVRRVLNATKTPRTFVGQFVDKIGSIGDAFRDVFEYEWRVKEYPKFVDQLRRFQGVQRDAQLNAAETVKSIVKFLGGRDAPKQYEVFRKLVFVRDLLADLETGKKIPGDLTQEQLLKAKAELEEQATDGVRKALEAHDRVFKAAWEELKRRGKVAPDSESKTAYVPHRVLDYLSENTAPGIARKLKAPYRYYLNKRGGTARLIDTDYIGVTLEHFAKLYMDNATDDFALEVARTWDKWPDLSEETKQELGPLKVGKRYEIDGKTYVGWSYEFSPLAKATLLQVAQLDPAEVPASIQKFRVVHAIPVEIADRLATLKSPGVPYVIMKAARSLQWAWKNVVLGPFGAGVPFQVNNFVGDVLNLVREDPAALVFIPKGWRAAKEWQKGKISSEFQEAIEVAEATRVVEAGLMHKGGRAYDPVFAELEPLRYIVQKYNPFEGYKNLSERRELSVRLAKLMKDLERINNGEMPVAKIFDVNELQSAGMAPAEIAGKIAREFGVDYSKLTPEAKAIVRDVLFPFATFYLQNAGNWVTYVRRHPGEFAGKFLLPLGAMALFNAMFFPEEEKKLPVYYRVMPHLITGYKTPDGKPIVIAFQTPIDQAAKMLGLEIVGDLGRQVSAGEKTADQAAKELAVHVFGGAQWESIKSLGNVFFKAPIEAWANKKAFNGAPIVDEAIANTPEGRRQRLNYIVQQWFTPVGQYAKVAQEVQDLSTNIKEWAGSGPADIKRALGIREVDLERETINRFYDRLDELEGAYAVWKEKRAKGEGEVMFKGMAELRKLRSIARDFTNQWKYIDRVKNDKARDQEEKDRLLRQRYISMAKRAENALGK